jgi:hypothetical protein
MSHDKIKAAARRRMTATGEPYAAARRQAISEHSADRFTSPVSAQDIRAAAETHRELGPDYSDAVVASFIDKVDRAVAARVEARLADREQQEPTRRGRRPLARRLARDLLALSAGALVAVGAVGLHAAAARQDARSVLATGTSPAEVGNSTPCHASTRPRVTVTRGQARPAVIRQGGEITFVCAVQGRASVHR